MTRVLASLSTGQNIAVDAPEDWFEPRPSMHNGAMLEIAPGHFVMAHLLVELVYKARVPAPA